MEAHSIFEAGQFIPSKCFFDQACHKAQSLIPSLSASFCSSNTVKVDSLTCGYLFHHFRCNASLELSLGLGDQVLRADAIYTKVDFVFLTSPGYFQDFQLSQIVSRFHE